jgi:hypothetical protein
MHACSLLASEGEFNSQKLIEMVVARKDGLGIELTFLAAALDLLVGHPFQRKYWLDSFAF